MAAILGFTYVVVSGLIEILIWIVVANAVVSWLVLFRIINLRNPTAMRIVQALDSAVRPLLRPIRRFVPPLGGLDLSPVIFILVLQAAQIYLLGPLFGWLTSLVGGPPAV